jgi:hypothetical protein
VHGSELWYCLAAAATGLRYDAAGPDRRWDPAPDWQVQSRRVNGTWQWTAMIPLVSVGIRAGPEVPCGIKLMVDMEKDAIAIWPRMQGAGEETCGVPHTSDPLYYARVLLP